MLHLNVILNRDCHNILVFMTTAMIVFGHLMQSLYRNMCIKKQMPVHSWGIKKFLGKSNESVSSFLEMIDEMRVSRNVDDSELLVFMIF